MPIHVACSQGNYELIKALIQFGSKCSAPDASAIYPVHLACTGLVGNQENTPKDAEKPEEDYELRLKCVMVMLDLCCVPITMKDGNKQSILHCSARAGNVKLINLISKRCQAFDEGSSEYLKFCNWTDHWYRTPLQLGHFE